MVLAHSLRCNKVEVVFLQNPAALANDVLMLRLLNLQKRDVSGNQLAAKTYEISYCKPVKFIFHS